MQCRRNSPDLRLCDGMIDLLKSGRVDNALLCELAALMVMVDGFVKMYLTDKKSIVKVLMCSE